MNNHTFLITEADTRPTTQQPHRDRKDIASCKRSSLLDQYECQYEVCGQAVHHVFRVPVSTAPRKGITLCNIMQTMGSSWCRYIILNGKTLLCIVDYHSKFPIVKKVNSL